MGRRQKYSPEFKLSMVHLVIDGEKTPSQVCLEHQVGKSALYTWLQDFIARGESAFQSGGRHLHWGQYQKMPKALRMKVLGSSLETVELLIAPESCHGSPEARLADLERLCGRLALENFLLKQALAEGGQSAPEVVR
jgi:transposase-like protein